ncbi:Hypothetical predicted protein [Cloeon dipterum]|uniref:Uncharacterized protein n=1 Tax=Cloeon dipterum TaxID=197152 RepID=A0A8S1C1D4_9INSE|nr:Hypothetical predicted protein [Cloeon dipterum]
MYNTEFTGIYWSVRKKSNSWICPISTVGHWILSYQHQKSEITKLIHASVTLTSLDSTSDGNGREPYA